MKVITLTELRKNIFRLADETLDSGEPLLIERNGRRLRLEEDKPATAMLSVQEQWERYKALPPSADMPSLSFEEIEDSGWTWDEEPELDR